MGMLLKICQSCGKTVSEHTVMKYIEIREGNKVNSALVCDGCYMLKNINEEILLEG
jgi:protein-arginine kinase activator protein McsA